MPKISTFEATDGKPYAALSRSELDMGCEVAHQGAEFGPQGPLDGWRVAVHRDGIETFIPLTFGCKQDAEIAAAAISDIIDWDGDAVTIYERLVQYGLPQLRRTMTECLRW